MIPQRLILTNNAHYLQCKINSFALSPPCLLILTFTFAFWPLTSSQKEQINTLFITACNVANFNWVNSLKFLYFTVIFHSKGNNLHVISDFICQTLFQKWSVWISRVYCSIVHEIWWCHPWDMPLSTWWQDDDICELWMMFMVKNWHFTGNLCSHMIEHVS